MFMTFMKLNDGLSVDASEMAWPEVFGIVPPVQLDVVVVQVPPLPLTVRLPLEPVPLRTMPFTAPFVSTLRKLSPLEPIVVPSTRSVVPVVEASVLAEPVTFTVPPPVALNAPLVPVLAVTPPVRLTVAPVFELRLIPVPV